MKKTLKSIVRWLPGKKWLFSLIRLFGVPSFYKSLRFKGSFAVALAGDVSIKLFNDDDYCIETEWFWRGIKGWEPASISIWMNLCSVKAFGPSPVILDLGACEGVYALAAKALSPEARVLAFEPMDTAFKRLSDNIIQNKLNIAAFKVACSDQDGTADLFVDGHANSTEASLVSSQLAHHVSVTSVPTRALSSLIEELHIKSFDLIKIDVEGAEPAVLRGMGSFLQKFRPVMIVEVLNDEAGGKVNQIMAGLNYCFWDINDDPRNGPLGIKPGLVITKGICLNWLLVPAEKVRLLEGCWSDLSLKSAQPAAI